MREDISRMQEFRKYLLVAWDCLQVCESQAQCLTVDVYDYKQF